jgi:hypothetical protein
MVLIEMRFFVNKMEFISGSFFSNKTHLQWIQMLVEGYQIKKKRKYIYKKPDSCKSRVIFSSSLSLYIKMNKKRTTSLKGIILLWFQL